MSVSSATARWRTSEPLKRNGTMTMPGPYRFPDYQVAGGDADTTIYLLHGAYGSNEYFRSEIETLTRAGYRVVAWNAPGYGISPLPVGGLSIEGLAEAAGRMIDRTASKTNIVLGHSMGGVMAPAVLRARKTTRPPSRAFCGTQHARRYFLCGHRSHRELRRRAQSPEPESSPAVVGRPA